MGKRRIGLISCRFYRRIIAVQANAEFLRKTAYRIRTVNDVIIRNDISLARILVVFVNRARSRAYRCVLAVNGLSERTVLPSDFLARRKLAALS